MYNDVESAIIHFVLLWIWDFNHRLKNVDLRRATRRSRDFTRSCGALYEDLTAVGYFAVAGT